MTIDREGSALDTDTTKQATDSNADTAGPDIDRDPAETPDTDTPNADTDTPSAETDPAGSVMTGVEVVRFLSDILGRRRPTTDGLQIIAADVRMHMDHYGFQGFDGWKQWIDYIQSRPRVADLTFTANDIVENEDGTLTLTGVWHGVYRGEQQTSNEGWAHYRVEEGKVVEIWTRRANYVFQFGPTMRHRWRWYTVFAHFAWWVKVGGGRKLTLSAAEKGF